MLDIIIPAGELLNIDVRDSEETVTYQLLDLARRYGQGLIDPNDGLIMPGYELSLVNKTITIELDFAGIVILHAM